MGLRAMLFVAAFAAAGVPAKAETAVAFGPTLEAAGWKTMTFRGIPPTGYAASGADALSIDAQKSSSLIWRTLPEAAFDAGAARWRWKATEAVPATDLAKKGGDDRVAALYFAFAPEGDRASAAAGAADMRRLLISGRGKLLVYTFGGAGPIGTVLPNPYARGSGVTIIARPASAATGAFLAEQVDLAGDYAKAFKGKPGPLVAVAIASDSDDTAGRNWVTIEGLRIGE